MRLFLKYSIGFVFSFILSMVVLELFMHTAQIEGTSPTDFDNIIGRKRRANLDFTFFNEGFSMGAFNEYSFLGEAVNPEKPKGTLRLAFLGDSYVESFQLFRRDQFYQVLEEELSKKFSVNVEVLNFGRSGFDLADMYAYQQRFVAQFNPDYIFYFLSDADLSCTQTDPLIPKVILKSDSLEVTNKFMPKPYLNTFNKTKVLTQNSSILSMANNCRKLITAGKFWPKVLDKFYLPTKSIEVVHSQNPDEVPALALKIVDNFSDNTIIVNRGSNDFPAYFTSEIESRDLVSIDLRDTLSTLVQQGINPNFWTVTKTSGHWNYEAHQAIGYFLSHKIKDMVRLEEKDIEIKN
jgi:hypothetical protein